MFVKWSRTRIWVAATLSVISTVVVGFAINYLSKDPTDWRWWLVLVASGSVGVVALYLSTRWATSERGSRVDESGQGGPNISINADTGSAAAWYMGDVHIGQPGTRGRRRLR